MTNTTRINVTLSVYDGDDWPEADMLYERYVADYLSARYPGAKLDITSAGRFTRAFVDGVPDVELAEYLANDAWAEFCAAIVPGTGH